jgi:hypothetical protein
LKKSFGECRIKHRFAKISNVPSFKIKFSA